MEAQMAKKRPKRTGKEQDGETVFLQQLTRLYAYWKSRNIEYALAYLVLLNRFTVLEDSKEKS